MGGFTHPGFQGGFGFRAVSVSGRFRAVLHKGGFAQGGGFARSWFQQSWFPQAGQNPVQSSSTQFGASVIPAVWALLANHSMATVVAPSKPLCPTPWACLQRLDPRAVQRGLGGRGTPPLVVNGEAAATLLEDGAGRGLAFRRTLHREAEGHLHEALIDAHGE
jgi:hypothetical protein